MEKQPLPNATLILVMGILSIVGCCVYGVPGFIFGLIAIVLGVKSTRLYKQDPENYSNYGNVNAGKIMGIIGLSLSIIYIILIIMLISAIGWAAISDPETFRDSFQSL